MPSLRPAIVLLTAVSAAALAVPAASAHHPSAAAAAFPAKAAAASSAPRAVPHATRSTDWVQYHGDQRRSGVAHMPVFHGGLHVAKRIGLDGAVYASPIVARGMTIVATEHNTVYAFNAANRLVWRRHLGAPSPAGQRPCGNIDPLGITGTPLYAPSRGLIFVAPEFSGNPPTHKLVALGINHGRVRFARSLDLAGVDRRVMQERGALAWADGRVWVPFGGLAGDCGQYKGRVVGYSWTGKGRPRAFTVPTAREAGIWTPPGPTVVDNRHMYVAVGNGASGVGDPYDFSDSVLRIDPHTARRTGNFSPSTWASDNAADLDLGSQGPAVVGTSWIFAAGKSGNAYVLRQSRLGGIGGAVTRRRVCSSFGGTSVFGNVVYVPCTDGVRAIAIGSRGGMNVRWHATAAVTGSPVLGGAMVWALDTGSGILHALNIHTGGNRGTVSVGAVSRFATPALSGRRILIGTLSGLTVVRY
jgi:outer membrane protein assembly factor BamB